VLQNQQNVEVDCYFRCFAHGGGFAIMGLRTHAPYRPYVIGLDGHIIKAIDLHCQKDEAAKARAKQLGHDVELWHGSRQIGLFKSKPKSPVTPSADHHGMTIVADVGTRCGEVNVTWITSQEWNSRH
jgi:hypothetical protein